MTKTLKQLLAEGKSVRVLCAGAIATPKLIEAIGILGDLDGVWLDQEHSAIPHRELELMVMAARAAGYDAFVRVAPTDYATVMRPFETGASGVMAAQVRSVAEVEQVVRWAKYPPEGQRGLFLGNIEARFGTLEAARHTAAANRDRWIVIQIETAEALECVEGIAAVDGVDCLFVGPSDLSANLGVVGQVLHPKCIAALERIARAAAAAKKSWGALSRTREHAELCQKLGARLFSIVSDMDLIHRGIQATRALYGDLYPPRQS